MWVAPLLPILAACLIVQPCSAIPAQAAQPNQLRLWHWQFLQDVSSTDSAQGAASAIDLQLDQAAASQPLSQLHLAEMPELVESFAQDETSLIPSKQAASADLMQKPTAELAAQGAQHQLAQAVSSMRCSEKQVTYDGQVMWVDTACGQEAAEQLALASTTAARRQHLHPVRR